MTARGNVGEESFGEGKLIPESLEEAQAIPSFPTFHKERACFLLQKTKPPTYFLKDAQQLKEKMTHVQWETARSVNGIRKRRSVENFLYNCLRR